MSDEHTDRRPYEEPCIEELGALSEMTHGSLTPGIDVASVSA